MGELLPNRYLLQVTRCRKLKPDGVELVIELRPNPQAGQEPPVARTTATTSSRTPPEECRE
jgi:hypothetical protein